MRDDLGVGVGGEAPPLGLTSSCFSAGKFSMMPLWITATRSRVSRCGWAFFSVGLPCVAQRVWPMP